MKSEKSQLGADDWILSKFDNNYKGYYLDIGAGDGHFISNTLKLDKKGWKGMAIDAFPRNFEDRSNTVVESAVLDDTKDRIVEFMVPKESEYSGIVDYLNNINKKEFMKFDHKVLKLKTSILPDILRKNKVPFSIDFLSIDIEGAEYKVLKTFPFNSYHIRHICVEHNYEEPKRTLIKDLLSKNGYFREKEVEWDDWYTNKSKYPMCYVNN